MREQLFTKIYGSLLGQYQECRCKLAPVQLQGDFEHLSLAELRELRQWASNALANMTTIVMVDFYYVVGMGNLTVVQLSKLTALLGKYLSYRPLLKTITSHFTSLDDIPQVPTKCTYTLQKLAAGAVLESEGEGHTFEEKASLTDLVKEREMPKECGFILDGMTIYLNKDKVQAFFDGFNHLGCGTAGDLEHFEQKLTRHGHYLGIRWERSTANAWVGTVTTVKIYDCLKKWYNRCKALESEDNA